MTYAKLAKQFNLSEAAKKSLSRCALGVWQEIGCDVLDAMGKETGKGEGVTMSRRNVIELVMDAGRLEEKATQKRQGKFEHPELAALWPKSWQESNASGWYDFVEGFLKKEVFLYTRYGF